MGSAAWSTAHIPAMRTHDYSGTSRLHLGEPRAGVSIDAAAETARRLLSQFEVTDVVFQFNGTLVVVERGMDTYEIVRMWAQTRAAAASLVTSEKVDR
jgi:hypothetical protein